jgi:hypothetical protein
MALDNPHHLRRRSVTGLAIAGLVGTSPFALAGSPAAIGAPALSASARSARAARST